MKFVEVHRNRDIRLKYHFSVLASCGDHFVWMFKGAQFVSLDLYLIQSNPIIHLLVIWYVLFPKGNSASDQYQFHPKHIILLVNFYLVPTERGKNELLCG